MPETPPTVGEIVAALLELDQDLPLVVSTHYDNDMAYSSSVGLTEAMILPIGDKNFWDSQDQTSPDPDSIKAVVLTGGMY